MDQNKKRERLAYKEYKLHMHVIDKDSKVRYVITQRSHHERKVYLSPAQRVDVLGKVLFTQDWHGYGNWRTLRELRRHFILITGAAKVLYG